MSQLSLLNMIVEDRKFTGAILQAPDGETKFLDIKEYSDLLKKTGKKTFVRFANESVFDEVPLDLEKVEISNEFECEYFGWYGGTAISIKK